MYLLDSNIIIYSTQPEYSLIRDFIQNELVFCSKLSRIETLGYHKITDAEKDILNRTFGKFKLLNISDKIIERAIQIRQQKKIGLPDAIIAATAQEYKFVLVTNNISDFKNISGLKLLNPMQQ